MADLPPAPETGTPRWVKVFGVIAIVAIVVLLLAMLFGGNHGPGRHAGFEHVAQQR